MAGWMLRLLVALALLGSALVHLAVWLDWARDMPVVGPLFLVNVVSGVVIAVAVLAWSSRLPALAAIAFGALTLAAYGLSLTVGFFGVQEQLATTEEVWGVITEVACMVFGGALLTVRDRSQVVR